MLNFLDKKNTDNSCKKIGFLGTAVYLEPLTSLFTGIAGTSIAGAYYDELTGVNSKIKIKSNPFGLISESDIIVLSKTDKNSFNLIVESILNSKHVVIANPYALEISEFEYIEKLCQEGSTQVLAYNSFKNWEVFEKIRLSIQNPVHMELEISEAIHNDNLRQRLFEILFLLHFVSKKEIKKINTAMVPIFDVKLCIIKLWVEFDNGCIATVSINQNADEYNFSLKSIGNNQILSFSEESNHISFFKKESTERISIEPKSYIHSLFEKLPQIENMNWFENQMTVFRKSLQQYHKLAYKFAFSKK